MPEKLDSLGNDNPLGGCQKLGGVGIIIQHPERSNGHDKRKDTLDNEDPPDYQV